MMEKFVYPDSYLKMRGNIKYCWEIHVKKMKSLWLPYVDYSAFYARLKRCNRDLYRSINTPLNYKKLEWYEKAFVWLRTEWFRFIYLFKKDEWGRERNNWPKYAC